MSVAETHEPPPESGVYVFHNGRRYVRPYYFEFLSHVKERWSGKNIVDLFAEEFRGRQYEYYADAVARGRIQVDGKVVPVSYVVKCSQKISHYLHRHEPSVMDSGLLILQNESDVLTVYKPASVPVHPCGQYRKNTVVGILESEHGLTSLFPVHRLDRLVSGLLIFARTSSRADLFRQEIEGGKVQKQYIARVVGAFPEEEVPQKTVDANVYYDAREGRSSVEHGLGKSACTKFTRLATNGCHSTVLCEPITGRTHQIRVHLQHMGHPIANDPLYCTSPHSSPHPPYSTAHDSDPSLCAHCPNFQRQRYDQQDREEPLWLHCSRYCGPGWTYQCPHPPWASLALSNAL